VKTEGEIKECSHCSGSSYGMCERAFGDSPYSCATCKKKAGVPFDVKDRVVCSVCGGKRKVWIGPSQSNEIFEYLADNISELTNNFGKILSQQAEILSRLSDLVANGE